MASTQLAEVRPPRYDRLPQDKVFEFDPQRRRQGGDAATPTHPDHGHSAQPATRRQLFGCPDDVLNTGVESGVLSLPSRVPGPVVVEAKDIKSQPGQARSELDCRKYLEQNDIAFKPAWLRDADDAVLLKRQIANLARSAQIRGKKREARELSILSRALEPRQVPRAARI